MDFAFNDLTNLIPTQICNELIGSNYFLQSLHSEEETPSLIWNLETKSELKLHVESKCSKLISEEFKNSNILYEKLNYKLYEKEICVENIYLRIYNQPKYSQWQIPNPDVFLSKLLQIEDKKLLFETLYNFLDRVSKKNDVLFRKLIDDVISKYVHIVFDIEDDTLLNGLKCLQLCLSGSKFIDKLKNTEILYKLCNGFKGDSEVLDITFKILLKLCNFIPNELFR